MGYARILGGGEDGRYTIEMDYGASTKASAMEALNALLAKIDTGIATQRVLNAAADALEAEQRARVLEAQQQVIDQTVGGLPPGSPKPDTTAYKFELLKLSKLQQKHAPMRMNLQALLFDRQQALRQVAKWSAFTPTETRQAWCADLTEDAPAGAYAATLDIPGESGLILLAPGCRAWSAGDGMLKARETMSPEQAFLNAALLPGWQKFMPTYRWGTCMAVDRDADTMNVHLAPAISSAQRLPVNQSSTLTGVPVVYMTCNAEPFEVGDRVVVQFVGQDWTKPRVIGFLDNPKPCEEFELYYGYWNALGVTSQTQKIYKNRDGEEVTTLAPFYNPLTRTGSAFVFCGWNDGVTTLTRRELNVIEDGSFFAQYAGVSGEDISSAIGLKTEDGATTYKRTISISYTGRTLISGPAPGAYESGWVSFAEALAFFVGQTATLSFTAFGRVIQYTWQSQADPDDSSSLIWKLTDVDPLQP